MGLCSKANFPKYWSRSEQGIGTKTGRMEGDVAYPCVLQIALPDTIKLNVSGRGRFQGSK